MYSTILSTITKVMVQNTGTVTLEFKGDTTIEAVAGANRGLPHSDHQYQVTPKGSSTVVAKISFHKGAPKITVENGSKVTGAQFTTQVIMGA